MAVVAFGVTFASILAGHMARLLGLTQAYTGYKPARQ
jgi:hypothetical protein